MKFIKFTFFIILIFLPIANWAMDIQEFKTKNGLKFWFVEDKSIPIISMSFTFLGGSFFDTKDKSGTANFLAALLDEGSGDLNGKEFQEKQKSDLF